jgi:kynurenine formamidase
VASSAGCWLADPDGQARGAAKPAAAERGDRGRGRGRGNRGGGRCGAAPRACITSDTGTPATPSRSCGRRRARVHNDGHSHLDALCHGGFDGSLYDGLPAGSVTSAGAETLTVGVLDGGLVGRGVLLDVPRQRRTRWIEPGEYLFREDLETAERHQGVQVGPGDVLLVRTGHARRLDELGPWDTTVSKAGLHPTAATFLAERQVAAMESDGNNDTILSAIEGVPYPIHLLAINAMGVHLLDYLRFEDLARHCERSARWEFLFVAAPLRIPGGTGSPVNPIAIF